jgi:hypothetical protein
VGAQVFFGLTQSLKPEGEAAMASLYEILGVPSTSTESQIKRAYHKLALKWHPVSFMFFSSSLGCDKFLFLTCRIKIRMKGPQSVFKRYPRHMKS